MQLRTQSGVKHSPLLSPRPVFFLIRLVRFVKGRDRVKVGVTGDSQGNKCVRTSSFRKAEIPLNPLPMLENMAWDGACTLQCSI